MKTNQTPTPQAFHLVLVLEFLYLEFVSDLELRISNFIVSPLEDIRNYELRTKNYKLYKSVSFRAFRAYPKTLFLQNEPNFKTTQNAVSPFSATVYGILSPVSWKKNKPKTKPIKPKFSFMINPVIPSKYIPFILSKSFVFIHVDSWFKKMANEPNFKTSKNVVSHIIKKTSIFCLLPSAPKNKPKRTQFPPSELLEFTPGYGINKPLFLEMI